MILYLLMLPLTAQINLFQRNHRSQMNRFHGYDVKVPLVPTFILFTICLHSMVREEVNSVILTRKQEIIP